MPGVRHRHRREVIQLHASDKFWFHPDFTDVVNHYEVILKQVDEVLQTEKWVASAFLNNNIYDFALNFLDFSYGLPLLAEDPDPVFALLLGFYSVTFVNYRSHISYLFNIRHMVFSSI